MWEVITSAMQSHEAEEGQCVGGWGGWQSALLDGTVREELSDQGTFDQLHWKVRALIPWVAERAVVRAESTVSPEGCCPGWQDRARQALNSSCGCGSSRWSFLLRRNF